MRKAVAKTSAGVLLDRDAVVHLVHAQNLQVARVAPELVILAHDQRFDRLCRADFRAEAAEAAPRQVEVKVVQRFDLLARFAVAAERNQVVGTRLRALIADDAGLRTCARFGLESEHAPKSRSGRPALCGVLKREGWLGRVLQS